ncbi:MAG: nucleoside hydrolase [candidate division KSB1 bacterium]|nr:nucleoside hydrolase [candidate division KSB1 bacterium]MDZ7346099.1 nucleoside hydrolase [candidate division KSB1 bacterium]
MKSVLFFGMIFLCGAVYSGPRLILNADTANEMDDLYAITYLLAVTGDELLAVSAAHFNNVDLLTDSLWNGYATHGIRTMELSFSLNRQLLACTGRSDVQCLKGAPKIIGRAWGGSEPRPSETSQLIIEEAMNRPAGEKLVLFTLGPVTDVASAVIEKPEIQDKIVLYMMGANYYPDRKAWNKNEFNVRNDLNAFDYLLDSKVEMHVMPASTAWRLKFERKKTLEKLGNRPLDKLLAERWDHVNAKETWIMWDLALVIAYFHPEFAKEEAVTTPPENRARSVWVYTDIDAERMENHFWQVYEEKYRR